MFLLTTRLNVVKRQSVPTQVTCNCQTGKGELNERRRAHSARPLVWVRFSTVLPATYVFLAFAFPFQALPLSAADERRHGCIAMFGLCKQTNVRHTHTQTSGYLQGQKCSHGDHQTPNQALGDGKGDKCALYLSGGTVMQTCNDGIPRNIYTARVFIFFLVLPSPPTAWTMMSS